jgi:hypothetical protein
MWPSTARPIARASGWAGSAMSRWGASPGSATTPPTASSACSWWCPPSGARATGCSCGSRRWPIWPTCPASAWRPPPTGSTTTPAGVLRPPPPPPAGSDSSPQATQSHRPPRRSPPGACWKAAPSRPPPCSASMPSGNPRPAPTSCTSGCGIRPARCWPWWIGPAPAMASAGCGPASFPMARAGVSGPWWRTAPPPPGPCWRACCSAIPARC